MELFYTKYKDKTYEFVGWSIIDMPQIYEWIQPELIFQIIQNSEYFKSKYGNKMAQFFNDHYQYVEHLLDEVASVYSLKDSPYIFKYSRYLRGTYVYKLINAEEN